VAAAETESSLSKSKLIKDYFRSTVAQEWLSGLAVLSFENSLPFHRYACIRNYWRISSMGGGGGKLREIRNRFVTHTRVYTWTRYKCLSSGMWRCVAWWVDTSASNWHKSLSSGRRLLTIVGRNRARDEARLRH
jgi:hypothetical protein